MTQVLNIILQYYYAIKKTSVNIKLNDSHSFDMENKLCDSLDMTL